MRISIITVTYNRANVISSAIEGVLSQNFKNYEYIIIDGASQDNTKEILIKYEEVFNNIPEDKNGFKPKYRWLCEPDNGIYDAINKGIRLATGDVVGIINSDDFFHRKDTFDIIATAFEDRSVDAIYCDERDMYQDDPNSVWIDKGRNFKRWQYRIGMMPCHQTFYARKSLFEKFGYYKTNYKIAADFELMLRMFYVHKASIQYIPEDILTFRTGGVSTQWKNKQLLNKETVQACKENGLSCCLPIIWLKYVFKIKGIFKILSHFLRTKIRLNRT